MGNQKERIRALFFFVPALTAETYGNSITELFKKSKYEAPQINLYYISDNNTTLSPFFVLPSITVCRLVLFQSRHQTYPSFLR